MSVDAAGREDASVLLGICAGVAVLQAWPPTLVLEV
jgi:hypothetical protein